MISLTILYAICASILALYTLGHGVLLIQYLRYRHQTRLQTPSISDFPSVTVQLPIYNERYVAVRLITAIANLEYPSDKLHIQILDDSDDLTIGIIASHILRYPHLNIEHVRRPIREGYKAGAMAYGLDQCDSPFVAIFDADFIPDSDFLLKTMPYLIDNPQLAVVQTRWGHLNPKANGLTRAQVISIDNHFIIEQAGRNLSGFMLPFNGTGGVWRTSAIYDAGGWSDDTLTEDLDLSFRAQLKGWQSLYLPEIVVPGELPPQLAAYRQQQARWAKGGSQSFRKLAGSLWASDLPLSIKLMATHHLIQYLPHLLMLIMLLLSPILIMTNSLSSIPLAPLGLIGLIPPIMYSISQQVQGGDWQKRLLAFPLLLLIGTGLIWQNALAVLSGFISKKGKFRRTPKFVSQWQSSNYTLRSKIAIFVQISLMLYSAWGVWVAWHQDPALVPYFIVHVLSFGTVALWDIRDQWVVQGVQSPKLLPESGND
ncbi:MAG: glycosyltransferase family 2 protein [Phototrophicaceae bacterium]